jgi:hypothetical protein
MIRMNWKSVPTLSAEISPISQILRFSHGSRVVPTLNLHRTLFVNQILRCATVAKAMGNGVRSAFEPQSTSHRLRECGRLLRTLPRNVGSRVRG